MNWRVIVWMLAVSLIGSQNASAKHKCDVANKDRPEMIVATCTDALQMSGMTAEQQAEFFFLRGVARLQSHSRDEVGAEQDYKQGLQLDPKHHRLHREVGNLALNNGDFELAYSQAVKAVTLGPENAANFEFLSRLFDLARDR